MLKIATHTLDTTEVSQQLPRTLQNELFLGQDGRSRKNEDYLGTAYVIPCALQRRGSWSTVVSLQALFTAGRGSFPADTDCRVTFRG